MKPLVKKPSPTVKRILWIVACILLLLLCFLFCINAYVKGSTDDRILSLEEAAGLEDADCILVLGCLVRSDGTPSDMLADRLAYGVALYESGVYDRLLMSGDHGTEDYDEVNAMKQYAVERGVPSSSVFMDHAGFSTYESIYRAKEVFGARRIVIVTQEYHLYRALYIARALGVEAYGVAADARSYRNQWQRDAREVLARNKDFWLGICKPSPTYLGTPVDLSGDGDLTSG